MRQQQIDRGEGDHAEDEGHRVGQNLFDDHLDVPQLVFEDGDGEGQRDQRQREDGDRRVDRLHRTEGQKRNDVDQKERKEAEDHPEVDPLDLLPADGGGGAIGVGERDDSEDEVDGEVRDLPPLDQLERAIWRRQRDAVAEQEEIEIPRRQQRRRNPHRREDAAMPDDRPRKDEEEVQRQRREDDRGEVFDQLQRLVERVDVAGRCVHIDDERQQRDEKEERRLAPAPSEEGEEPDGEIEKADEAEDQVGVVDLQLGDAVGEFERLSIARHHHRHLLADATQRLLQPFDLRRRRVADHPDLVAAPKAGGLRVAAGIDRLDHHDAVVAGEGEIDPFERRALPLERGERPDHQPQGDRQDQKVGYERSAHGPGGPLAFNEGAAPKRNLSY